MIADSSYLLVIHGSRHPVPDQEAAKLAQLLQQQLAQSHQAELKSDFKQPSLAIASPTVKTAALELAPTPLHQQIEACAKATAAQGGKRVEIFPLFLLPGVHVREDIPAQIAQARQNLEDYEIELELHDYLGSNQGVIAILAQQFDCLAQQARILIAHGSRRQESDQAIRAIAGQLNASVAYWSVPPSLETQVKRLIAQGQRQIAIVPYFLFAGGITEALAAEVAHLQQLYSVELRYGQPLGATPQLAQILIDQIAA